MGLPAPRNSSVSTQPSRSDRPRSRRVSHHVTGDYRSQRLRDRGERWPHGNRRRFPVRRHFMESPLAGRGLRKLAERTKSVDTSLGRFLRGARRRAIRGEADQGSSRGQPELAGTPTGLTADAESVVRLLRLGSRLERPLLRCCGRDGVAHDVAALPRSPNESRGAPRGHRLPGPRPPPSQRRGGDRISYPRARRRYRTHRELHVRERRLEPPLLRRRHEQLVAGQTCTDRHAGGKGRGLARPACPPRCLARTSQDESALGPDGCVQRNRKDASTWTLWLGRVARVALSLPFNRKSELPNGFCASRRGRLRLASEDAVRLGASDQLIDEVSIRSSTERPTTRKLVIELKLSLARRCDRLGIHLLGVEAREAVRLAAASSVSKFRSCHPSLSSRQAARAIECPGSASA